MRPPSALIRWAARVHAQGSAWVIGEPSTYASATPLSPAVLEERRKLEAHKRRLRASSALAWGAAKTAFVSKDVDDAEVPLDAGAASRSPLVALMAAGKLPQQQQQPPAPAAQSSATRVSFKEAGDDGVEGAAVHAQPATATTTTPEEEGARSPAAALQQPMASSQLLQNPAKSLPPAAQKRKPLSGAWEATLLAQKPCSKVETALLARGATSTTWQASAYKHQVCARVPPSALIFFTCRHRIFRWSPLL